MSTSTPHALLNNASCSTVLLLRQEILEVELSTPEKANLYYRIRETSQRPLLLDVQSLASGDQSDSSEPGRPYSTFHDACIGGRRGLSCTYL